MVNVLLIKYDKTDLDMIGDNGAFGYFYGDNEFIEFNEYACRVQKKFDEYDNLIDYLSEGKTYITDYDQITKINRSIIIKEIQALFDQFEEIKVYLLECVSSPQDPNIMNIINKFIFSKQPPSQAKNFSMA